MGSNAELCNTELDVIVDKTCEQHVITLTETRHEHHFITDNKDNRITTRNNGDKMLQTPHNVADTMC